MSIGLISALSSLSSLQDVTLHFQYSCHALQELGVEKFHDLISLVVTITYYSDDSVLVVDHLSVVIKQSPLLQHLSVLQHSYSYGENYDISFHTLTELVSQNQPLQNLESIHFAISDLALHHPSSVHHLKALRSLHIAGSIETSTCNGSTLWNALSTEKIKLREISVTYLSKSLLKYLESYSCLERLHILLHHLLSSKDYRYEEGPMKVPTKYEIQHFFQNILPRHSLSLALSHVMDESNVNDNYSASPSLFDGLLFERNDLNKHYDLGNPASIPTAYRFVMLLDVVPLGLSFVLDCSTQSDFEHPIKKIFIDFSSTLMPSGCGTGRLRQIQIKRNATNQWISQMKVLAEDVVRYPHSITIGGSEYTLRRDKEGYIYSSLSGYIS